MMRISRMSRVALNGAALLMVAGCTAAIVATVYTSSPEIQTLSRPDYDIRFQPITDGQNFFTLIKLGVTNKTGEPLEIDWNLSRYLYQGKSRGGFVFAGIDPKDIGNGTIPNGVIAGNGRFLIEIAPRQLVAMAPMKDPGVKAGKSGISGGILPDGVNGMRLVLIKDGRRVEEELSVTIQSQNAP